ncbi:MAG: hypothetical protein LBI39_00260 [Puniceicoccales bacterium]|nr:hypothetical protein [Puniceicoccales bacterium]
MAYEGRRKRLECYIRRAGETLIGESRFFFEKYARQMFAVGDTASFAEEVCDAMAILLKDGGFMAAMHKWPAAAPRENLLSGQYSRWRCKIEAELERIMANNGGNIHMINLWLNGHANEPWSPYPCLARSILFAESGLVTT